MLPAKIWKNGHPKGHEFSVTGLPYKKKSATNEREHITFQKVSISKTSALDTDMDSWEEWSYKSFESSFEKIGVDKIPKANLFRNSLLDNNVDVSTVNDYLTKDAWNKLLKLASK